MVLAAAQRIGTSKRYITSQPESRFGETIRAGFEYEVSVPNWFARKPDDPWWLRILKWFLPDPHSPLWLYVALWHDWFLENGYSKPVASWYAIRAMWVAFPWWMFLIWAPPTFIITLIVTTLSPPLRRVFSWAKGTS